MEQDILNTLQSLDVTFGPFKHIAINAAESDRSHAREIAYLNGDWMQKILKTGSCDELKKLYSLVQKEYDYMINIIFMTLFEMLWAQDNRGEAVCMDQVVFLRSLGFKTHPFHWETVAGVPTSFVAAAAIESVASTVAEPTAQRLLEPLTFAEFIALENRRDALYEQVRETIVRKLQENSEYRELVEQRNELIGTIQHISEQLTEVNKQILDAEKSVNDTVAKQFGEAAALGKKITELRKRVIG